MLIVFLLMLLFSALILMALGVDKATLDNPNGNHLAITIVGSMLLSYSTLFYISNRYLRQCFLKQLNTGLSSFSLAILLGLLTALLVLQLQAWFPAPDSIQTSISQALNSELWAISLVFIGVIIIAPIGEEYLFRGVLFDSLNKKWGLPTATALSSVIFTLFHLFEYHQYWVAWFAVFCLAVMLAILRHTSQSMLNPIAMHATYNATLLIIGSN
ncbi:CPBP family intramembrane glutamic endopeptidase [Kangiella sp. HZ709]|uniref:CPBP family intramembrane glutamic endopeptidase n=1 Tax=Kangiella sp. HZ709 TaxID=2666328 RepID=UPI0018A1C604|nr:type II CAAX endopeptidase family protein [Kangiella sp. HZ709]